MVRLNIKRGDQSQFLFDTTLSTEIASLQRDIVAIFNGRLKVARLCDEIETLAAHGPMHPPEILGLTEEQVDELKLVDPFADSVVPQDGWQPNKDPCGRRNGRQPKAAQQKCLLDAVEAAKKMVSRKLVDTNEPLVFRDVQRALAELQGAVTIVYPMQLPPHDVIRMEFTNTEDLSGTQASLEVMQPAKAQLWFAGRHLLCDRKLGDYLGTNEKCKIVLKLCRNEEGQPAREPVMSEEARKQLMLQEYRRQEELKKLEANDDDQYLNAGWADGGTLKRQMHGMENVRFRSGM